MRRVASLAITKQRVELLAIIIGLLAVTEFFVGPLGVVFAIVGLYFAIVSFGGFRLEVFIATVGFVFVFREVYGFLLKPPYGTESCSSFAHLQNCLPWISVLLLPIAFYIIIGLYASSKRRPLLRLPR